MVVVCLNGKKVTDEYRCFVSPYKMKERLVGRGHQPYGPEAEKFKALESVVHEFVIQFGYHEDVLFLTDDNSESLYPFLLYSGKNRYNNTHLCAISPIIYEWRRYKYLVSSVMNEHPSLESLFYIDIAEFFDKNNERETLREINERMTEYFEAIFPRILNGINKMKDRSYFDFSSMSYVPLTDGFESIDVSEKTNEIKDIDFDTTPQGWLLGRVCYPEYPSDKPYDLERAEQLTARIDGKNICNILREQRIRLAQANNIPFESEECPSIGPCAGTCRKCDSEAEYLRKELEKISEDKRIYPQFNVLEEMNNDR